MTRSKFFPDGFQGRHMALFLGVFFGVMLLVNGIFLYFAISTFNGLSTEDAYRKGLKYNERLDEEARQNRLGWTNSVITSPDQRSLTLVISARNGKPVTGLNLSSKLSRPASDRYDTSLEFSETKQGIYIAPMKDIQAGNWTLTINARQQWDEPGKIVYRMKKRIWLTQTR